jgi:hypothetical protein
MWVGRAIKERLQQLEKAADSQRKE